MKVTPKEAADARAEARAATVAPDSKAAGRSSESFSQYVTAVVEHARRLVASAETGIATSVVARSAPKTVETVVVCGKEPGDSVTSCELRHKE